MTLQAKHLVEWQASGVALEIIKRNVWSIDDSSEVDELLNRNTKRRWKHSEELTPCWAVAGCDPKTGERIYRAVQIKPDTAPIDEKTGKPRKYFSPSQDPLSPLFLEVEDADYWKKVITDYTRPILITEGAKKAGAILSQGAAAISLPGVATGGKHGRLKPELELLATYGRAIYLAFDRDIIQKKPVQLALHNLGRMLAERGAMVYVLEWADNHKGIDDWLASMPDVTPITNEPDARAKALRSQMRSAKTLEEWKAANDEGQGDSVDLDNACRLAKRYRRIEEKLQGRLRWNELKSMAELDGQPAELDDIRIYLALKHNLDIPEADCTQIVIHLAKQQSFNPVAEYLQNIAQHYPPDSDLLDSLALTYLGTDSKLHATYIRKTLISAVARALAPGCKVDTVCILAGLQEVGKSTFWKILAGEDNFDDSIGSVSDKDERLKLHKSWMIEWAELETVFKRKDVSAVKAFITTQTDQLRPPYGRAVMEFKRPSIIVGTTNYDNFLSDSTGNRRFWVIPISIEAIPLDQLAKERDRIWAAAVHAYVAGEHWKLPAHLKAEAKAEAAEFLTTDPWEDPVLSYVSGMQTVTVDEILSNAIRLELAHQDKRSEMRVTDLLKANGWRSGRKVVQARRVRVWFFPSFTSRGCPGRAEVTKRPTEWAGQPPGQPPAQPPGTTPQNVPDYEQFDFIHRRTPNLDGLDGQIPKSSNDQEFYLCSTDESLMVVGGRVRISVGRFKGKLAKIVTLDEKSDRAVVIADGWRDVKHYSCIDLVPVQ